MDEGYFQKNEYLNLLSFVWDVSRKTVGTSWRGQMADVIKYRTTDPYSTSTAQPLWEALQCHHHWNLRNSFWGPEETRIHVTCWNVNSLWNHCTEDPLFQLVVSWQHRRFMKIWTGRKDLSLSTGAVRCCEACLFLVCGSSNVERLGFFIGGLFSYAQHMQVWLWVAFRRCCWAKIVVHEMLHIRYTQSVL